MDENIPQNKNKLGLIIEAAFKILIILRKYTDVIEHDKDEEDKGDY